MIIKRTIYVETVEILVLGASRWRKQGLEAELEEGDDVVLSSVELKKIVDTIHSQNNIDVDIPPQPPAPKTKTDPVVNRMRILIDSATTKAEMEKYRYGCPKELLSHFEDKIKKLKK